MVKDGEFTDHILTIIAMANFHQNLYFCSTFQYSFGIDTYTVCVYLSPKFHPSISAASPITALHFSLTHIPVPYTLLPTHSISSIILCTTSLEPRVHFPAKSFIYFELYAYKSKFVYAIHMSDESIIF